MQVPPADIAKQTVKLIDGEHCCRRIIDRLGQSPDRYVDNDAQREGGILLDGSLTSECNQSSQPALVERTAVATEQKDRLADSDEIADPGHDFDHTVNTTGFDDERLEIYGQHDCRGTPMHQDTVGSAKLTVLCGQRFGVSDGPRIHALDDRKALLADAP